MKKVLLLLALLLPLFVKAQSVTTKPNTQSSTQSTNVVIGDGEETITIKGTIKSTITTTTSNTTNINHNNSDNSNVNVRITVNGEEVDPYEDIHCEKPNLEWLSPYESASALFEVKIGVNSNTEIIQSEIKINGTTTRGMKTVQNDGYQKVLNQTVTLKEGLNRIKVSVTNTCGTTKQTFLISYIKSNPSPTPTPEPTPKPTPTYYEKRVALVIGNANYPGHPLGNPVNDANDIAASLRRLGFEVTTVINGTKRQMEEAVSDLRKSINSQSVALFYYAGHGIQKDGRNYLVPVDAEMRDASDVEYACTDMNRVLSNMESSGCTRNIVVMDACRDNPFERSWTRGLGTRGLSNIGAAPDGTIILYSTNPGEVALDGQGRNSPYAQAFLQALDIPGLGIYEFYQEVSTTVKKNTNNSQKPWMVTNYNGQFYFHPAQ